MKTHFKLLCWTTQYSWIIFRFSVNSWSQGIPNKQFSQTFGSPCRINLNRRYNRKLHFIIGLEFIHWLQHSSECKAHEFFFSCLNYFEWGLFYMLVWQASKAFVQSDDPRVTWLNTEKIINNIQQYLKWKTTAKRIDLLQYQLSCYTLQC